MKYRIAKKIWNAIGTVREAAYTTGQKNRAIERYCRTRSSKRDDAFWDGLMRWLGPEGRADLVKDWDAGKALDILMRTPENEWKGDPAAWPGAPIT